MPVLLQGNPHRNTGFFQVFLVFSENLQEVNKQIVQFHGQILAHLHWPWNTKCAEYFGNVVSYGSFSKFTNQNYNDFAHFFIVSGIEHLMVSGGPLQTFGTKP